MTALIAKASTADHLAESAIDGSSGDTALPHVSGVKARATVGEVNSATDDALTGWPDGHAAWLQEEHTVRVVCQSVAFSTMSAETYPWQSAWGATFTASHVHTFDQSRMGPADFRSDNDAAATIFSGSGHLFDTVRNQYGDEVVPKSEGGVWGTQNGTLSERGGPAVIVDRAAPGPARRGGKMAGTSPGIPQMA